MFLDTYLAIILLMTIWLGWLLYRTTDEFDWKYNKSDLWFEYFLCALFWPLLLRKPSLLLKGEMFKKSKEEGVLDLSGNIAERMRNLQQIIDTPPPCGKRVAYRYRHFYEQSSEVDIIFNSADIEQHFKGETLPLHFTEECHAIINFIKGRRDDWEQVESIPSGINFEPMAFRLIGAGYGEVECKKCGKVYPVTELTTDCPSVHEGWNTKTYSCSEGHKLFKYDYAHFQMRRD